MNRIAEFFQDELRKNGRYDDVASLSAFVGDIHNHSGISYGYGSIENAVAFAEAQLDFFSVTGHFAWPDISLFPDRKVPDDVVAYHSEGFRKLRRNWSHYRLVMSQSCIVPFLSYEYHSFYYGDYTILCRSLDEELPAEPEGEDRRLAYLLLGEEGQQERFLCTPHHIGYRTGYRGINWEEFSEKVSPVVEIVSMHGCAESHEARQKYLHTMGPRSDINTYQGGLGKGHHFGVIGSTDHHNAAPGSYGAGRTVLFAHSRDRDEIWDAIRDRSVSAATGDPIEAMLFVNGTRAGKVAEPHDGLIDIEAYVSSYDALEKVELIQDGKVIMSSYAFPAREDDEYEGTVSFMFGWGKKHKSALWDISLRVMDGRMEHASPRLRGVDMVDPLDMPDASSIPVFTRMDGGVDLHIVTDGNPTAFTDATQGFVLDISGDQETRLELSLSVKWDGRTIERLYSISIDDLRNSSFTDYIDGFVSPSFEIGTFRRRGECLCSIKESVKTDSQGAVYLRCYQKNGDALYTSPVSFRKEG